ncbi:hypothetical protein CN582_25610 [Bacillus wiedmannii]|uniref:hypothetical protein n=1 Tax=Bacillus wiedmannii TaxID=1890302 RepID=UPI000BF24FE0|nr:hypothetical protein [Bacillus wiedmannii]PEP19434.1 hypothetical protein CN580_25985 [Bacillus wiedmannii]PEP91991.1 hypothetical protein CN582_25610 [Bacillus wiedmannii]PFY70585.1 hypothetical protein COL61_19860 [Bacillus wiedmannii]PHF06980.1 hypothetical protein COF74_18250 [Bacillus wiedmannii]PHF97213.1 hypothetical protein COI45_07055 [Bacillus wiedmannii]
MIKKFTRVVLTAIMPIGMIAGCGNTEKTEAKEPKAVQSEKNDYTDYSYGSKGIVVSGKAKERQQYEVGYMDDNKLIGIDENIEDCIILDNKDEAGLVWKQIERGSIIEVQYGKDRNDIVGVQLVGDREPYEISDKFDRNTINEIVENVKGNL